MLGMGVGQLLLLMLVDGETEVEDHSFHQKDILLHESVTVDWATHLLLHRQQVSSMISLYLDIPTRTKVE